MLLLLLTAEMEPPQKELAEKIYAQYGNKIYGLALLYLKNKHDAEDVLGDVMIKIIQNIDKFVDFDSTKTASLIVIYTRSAAIDCCRKRKRRSQKEVPFVFENENGELCEFELPASENTEKAVIDAEASNDVFRVLQLLPPRQLDAIKLIYAMGFSYKEAADAMGITENAVASLVSRGKENLKKIMGDKLYEYLG